MTRIDGESIASAADLRNAVGLLRVGKSIELTVLRGSDEITVTAVIEPRVAESVEGGDVHPALKGATFAPIPEELKNRGIPYGVYVQSVEPNSTAWQNELRENDVITSANRIRITTLDEFRQVVGASDELLFSIRRGRQAFFLAIR